MSAVNQEPELIPVPSLQEFFRDSVDAAMASNKVAVDDHTAHYVVNLLTVFVRSEALYDQMPPGPRLQPLALMLADAAEASGDERNMALRRMGDVALFVAGFMAGCMDRSPVGINYYVRMAGAPTIAWLCPCHPARAGGRSPRYMPNSRRGSWISSMC